MQRAVKRASRYHDFCAGHRVTGHESKCAHLHGHNYRVHITVEQARGGVDTVGRVVDFSEIKRVGNWIEENWDHRMLIWEEDPMADELLLLDRSMRARGCQRTNGVLLVPFNPTAENMAEYLLFVVGPDLLEDLGVRVVGVRVEETRKCEAVAYRTDPPAV